jgi:hypothetical protein
MDEGLVPATAQDQPSDGGIFGGSHVTKTSEHML